VCRPGARIALLCGDAEAGGVRIDAGEQLARLGRRAGLAPVASAAELHPDPRGGPPRREHLVLFETTSDHSTTHGRQADGSVR
jgi:hypothetical protein